MKTNWQDPQTSEIRSTHISGLQDAIGKIEDVLDLKLQAETNVPLTEVYISELDRYRIYQAPAGKRNWASSPSPVIKKNGVVISSGFTIDYGGGAIIASPSATSTDTFTADVSYTKTGDNALDAHKAENVSYNISITRDLSLPDSEQIVTLINGRTAKHLIIYAEVADDSKACWGFVATESLCITQMSNGNMSQSNVRAILLRDNISSYVTGNVIIESGQIKIVWAKTGEITGTAHVKVLAVYHD